jgi:hypothetical protein
MATMRPKETQTVEAPRDMTSQSADEEAAAAIEASHKRLGDMLGGMQGTNLEQIFAPFMESIKSRQLPKAPGRGEAFVRGFSSPMGAASVMHQLAERHKAEQDQQDQLSDMEGKLLQAKLNKEMSAGDEKKALATLKEKQMLDFKLASLKRDRDVAAWKEKQRMLYGEKGALEEKKGGIAQNLIKTKIQEIAKAANIDPNKLLAIAAAPALIAMRARTVSDPMLPETKMPEQELQELSDSTTELIWNYARDLQKEFGTSGGKRGGGTSPPPATTPPAATKSRARIEYEKMQAEKNKGKK